MSPGSFDLPPDDATPSQLLLLIREQRNSNAMMAQRLDIMAEQVNNMAVQVRDINEDTKGLKIAFSAARTTLAVVKWAAALAAIFIGIIEGIRRVMS